MVAHGGGSLTRNANARRHVAHAPVTKAITTDPPPKNTIQPEYRSQNPITNAASGT